MEAMNTRARQDVRRYLEIKDYEVLENGWSHEHDSIDFIATDEESTLVFIAFETSGNEGEDSQGEAGSQGVRATGGGVPGRQRRGFHGGALRHREHARDRRKQDPHPPPRQRALATEARPRLAA